MNKKLWGDMNPEPRNSPSKGIRQLLDECFKHMVGGRPQVEKITNCLDNTRVIPCMVLSDTFFTYFPDNILSQK